MLLKHSGANLTLKANLITWLANSEFREHIEKSASPDQLDKLLSQAVDQLDADDVKFIRKQFNNDSLLIMASFVRLVLMLPQPGQLLQLLSLQLVKKTKCKDKIVKELSQRNVLCLDEIMWGELCKAKGHQSLHLEIMRRLLTVLQRNYDKIQYFDDE